MISGARVDRTFSRRGARFRPIRALGDPDPVGPPQTTTTDLLQFLCRVCAGANFGATMAVIGGVERSVNLRRTPSGLDPTTTAPRVPRPCALGGGVLRPPAVTVALRARRTGRPSLVRVVTT